MEERRRARITTYYVSLTLLTSHFEISEVNDVARENMELRGGEQAAKSATGTRQVLR